MDVYDKIKRSEIMSKVRYRNGKSTELKLIKMFKDRHITGWRRTYKMIGKPDFVFPKQKIVIFVDGCFWHGHDCRNVTPKNNADYWDKKRERNIQRDKAVTQTILNRGWRVVRIWECELKVRNISQKVICLLDELENGCKM